MSNREGARLAQETTLDGWGAPDVLPPPRPGANRTSTFARATRGPQAEACRGPHRSLRAHRADSVPRSSPDTANTSKLVMEFDSRHPLHKPKAHRTREFVWWAFSVQHAEALAVLSACYSASVFLLSTTSLSRGRRALFAGSFRESRRALAISACLCFADCIPWMLRSARHWGLAAARSFDRTLGGMGCRPRCSVGSP